MTSTRAPFDLEVREAAGALLLPSQLPESDPEDQPRLGVVSGWALRYQTWASISDRDGQYMETFAPGAFDATIRGPRGSKIRLMYDHGHDHVVGSRPVGGPLHLESDGAGLKYRARMYPTSYNRDLAPALRDGQFGASVRFAVIKDRFVARPGRSKSNPDGISERTVVEARLAEISITLWPAYDSSSASLRAHLEDDDPQLQTRVRWHLT